MEGGGGVWLNLGKTIFGLSVYNLRAVFTTSCTQSKVINKKIGMTDKNLLPDIRYKCMFPTLGDIGI